MQEKAKLCIEKGATALGIEFGSTRIKVQRTSKKSTA